MPNTSTDLPLRDIHLPDAVSWWPLAPGWWILLVCLCVLIIGLYLVRRWHLSKAIQRNVASEIETIKKHFHTTNNQYELIQSLSTLLRRACISYYPRQETAGLTGDAWLKYLDDTAPSVASITTHFYNGPGAVLTSAPYMSESSLNSIDHDQLIHLCETWLLAQPVKSQSMKPQSGRAA